MSSESDPDEFYDAQEPSSPRSKEARTKDENAEHVVVEEDPFEKEIVAEERRLLEERKLAEERRRKEDEELQRKLAELEKRKILEAEKKEAARRAQENESRRRKLDDMRMMMEEESTPNRAPPKPPRINDDSSVDNEQMRSCDEGGLDILIPPGCGISQLDVSSRDHDNTGHSPQRSFSQNSAELYEDAPSQAGSPGPYVDCDNRNVLNVNPPVFHQEKLQHKNIPIMSDAKNTNEDSPNIGLLSNSSTMDSINVNVLFDQEPDIIQSVKSSSLPRPSDQLPKPAQPVAPPRKKKKNKTPLTSGQDDSEESIPQAVDSEGQLDSDFVSEPETPTSTVYNLTKDLERSLSMPGGDELGREKLDITSATRGHRMVTAVEDESARGDSLERLKSANTVVVAQGQTDAQMESDNVTNTSREHHRVVFTPEMGEPLELAISTIASSESFLIPGVRDANQTPIHMERPRSMSGSRYMTDKEILEQVTVLNLDTGERVPLSQAEDKLPRCINPLSLHIMRRTKEYSSDSSLHKYMDQSDDESIKDGATGHEPKTLRLVKVKKRGKKLKKFIGKTVSRMKSTLQHKEENSSDEDEVADERRMIKVKASHSHKGPYDFDLLVPVQDMKGDQEGAVWTMKFSHCGRLLATGGQDNLMRVWVLKESYTYFDDMRQKYSEATKVSPAPSQESLSSQPESVISETSSLNEPVDEDDEHAPFMRKPFCIYKGHTADLLDISWSKNYFILSSSMDKTVRLWHVSRKECLCCFQHIDFVTAIAFHPKDDRYFLSGSLDGKLRLWNIPDKKVALWNEVSGHNKMITAANFCLNGKFAVVGTYDGRCIFYSTDQLKYHTHIHVRSTRGKNARGRKITGVEPHPGEDKVLVTSNDSRIRLYDLRDLTLSCKYKGCSNNSSQIKASFSHDGKYIICGSEDRFVYIWRSQHEFYQIFSSARRDRNDFWEGIKAHLATVTVAVFAPNPHLIIKPQFQQVDPDDQDTVGVRGEVLISADYTGTVKVFINKFKPGSG